MKWKVKPPVASPAYGDTKSVRKFALWPTKVNDYCVWLERYYVQYQYTESGILVVEEGGGYTFDGWVEIGRATEDYESITDNEDTKLGALQERISDLGKLLDAKDKTEHQYESIIKAHIRMSGRYHDALATLIRGLEDDRLSPQERISKSISFAKEALKP